MNVARGGSRESWTARCGLLARKTREHRTPWMVQWRLFLFIYQKEQAEKKDQASLLAILGHGLPLSGIKSSDALALPKN